MNAAEKIMYVFVKILLLSKEVMLKILRSLRIDKLWKKLMSLKRLYRIIILVIIISLFVGTRSMMGPSHRGEVKVVEVHHAKKRNLVVTTKLLGLIQTKNFFTVKSGSDLMGFSSPQGNLAYIAQAGTKLKKGELIAYLDAPEIKAQYEAALKSTDIARRRYERENRLRKAGASSQHSVEQKFMDLAGAESNLAKAKSSYNSAYFEAPFDGIVGSSSYSAGSEVKSGKEIVSFFDPSKLIIRFDIPTNVASKLKDKTSIIFNEKEFETSFIQKVLSKDSYTIPAHAEIECEDCMIGESRFFDIIIAKKEDAIIIPDSCVFIFNGNRAVYKVKDDKAELVIVQIGEKQEKLIEIIDGVEEGDVIISAGQNRLHPEIKVKIYKEVK